MADKPDDVIQPLRKGDLGKGHIDAPSRISRWRAVRSFVIGLLALIGGYVLIRQFISDAAAAAFLVGWALHGLVVVLVVRH